MLTMRKEHARAFWRPVVFLLCSCFFFTGCGDDSAYDVVVTQHSVLTQDQVKITLFRYSLDDDPSEATPILLCPGFSENHLAFDLGPGCSMARHLASLGIDAWAIDFRGRGASGVPSGTGLLRGTWSIDDYGYMDIRAAARYISDLAPDGRLFLLGFSEGDAASAAFMLEGDRSVVAGYIGLAPGTVIGATNQQPVEDFPPFQFLVSALSPAAGLIPANVFIPFAELIDMAYEMADALGIVDQLLQVPLWNIVWNTENMTDKMAGKVLTEVLGDISSNVLRQFLGGARYTDRKGICTFRDSALEQAAGGPFCYLDRLPEIDVPLLVLAGNVDVAVPRTNAQFVFDQYGSTDKTFRILGRQFGQIDDYGHDDLTFGIHVNQDVSPVIAEWITERM